MENLSAEQLRLNEDAVRQKNWKRWGPYLSERQWGTVREDYSHDGNSWAFLKHDYSRSQAYRWGEDGILGISDRQCRICFALCMWNGKDPILKERLFGLTGPEGNHGEDVKESYFYLDSTPTHCYMKGLYKYPQAEFPYKELVSENGDRDRLQSEFELEDTGIFDDNNYFDVFAEYAKASPNDLLIRITVHNRADQPAPFHFLPNLWFRNTWTWGCQHEGCWPKPYATQSEDDSPVRVYHSTLEPFYFVADEGPDGKRPQWLFTDNETNAVRFQHEQPAPGPYKDAFHEYIVEGKLDALSKKRDGTKLAAYYQLEIAAGESVEYRFRLYAESEKPQEHFGKSFDKIFQNRLAEADEFYQQRFETKNNELSEEDQRLIRQSNAGLLWTKQFYHYIVENWLAGDPEGHPVPPERKFIRNSEWIHLFNRDVISMPDKWEYPWYAAWDLAFHMIPFCRIDQEFAKKQLILFLREWYMHPNGQIPAYEWAFSDVNPPVHAWACWRVYEYSKQNGQPDRLFLSRTFQKLLLNFTWWVNRVDVRGNNLFSGGFLGLDNIGIFDRSKPLPTGGHLEQADGTAWMAFFCANMLTMAMELAKDNQAYADMASKFFEHYITIAEAFNCEDGGGLWDEQDGFYYDHIYVDGQSIPLRIRSLVGLIPLLTVCILREDVLEQLPNFRRRMEWFVEHNSGIDQRMSFLDCPSQDTTGIKRLLGVPSEERLRSMLRYMLDENEFLSPYGIRSLSKIHAEHPYEFEYHGEKQQVSYVPGESDTYMFGGNSNWRGPIWFPINYLIVESLEQYHSFYGDSFQIECPTGSGNMMNLRQVADEIRSRLIAIFERDDEGKRPFRGDCRLLTKAECDDLFLFYEYFHADTGLGLGASHQTGWTALVATLLETMRRE